MQRAGREPRLGQDVEHGPDQVTSTELAGHNRPEIQEGMQQRFGDMELLEAQDIADTVLFIVTRPRHASVNEVLIRPTEQDQ